MRSVGVREFKARLSHYLRAVGRGERIVISRRTRPVAILAPADRDVPGADRLMALLADGTARWGGGKPRGAGRPPRVRGPSVARAVTEDRR